MSPKKDKNTINEKTKYEFLQELGITTNAKDVNYTTNGKIKKHK